MLTYVKDHLTGEMIPVRYIEPGTETALDDFDQLAAISVSEQSRFFELLAMSERRIEDFHVFEPVRRGKSVSQKRPVDLEKATLAEFENCRTILSVLAEDLTTALDSTTAAPIRFSLMVA